MDEFRTCPALLCEDWTPGRKDSADGPSRHIHRYCTRWEHPMGGAHVWGEPIVVKDEGRPAKVLW